MRYTILFLLAATLMVSCGKKETAELLPGNEEEKTSAKITFVELGSVNCIPCRQMQPVMKSIEEKYKGQVKVVFHDVWKDKAPAQKYGIQLIPTQVFLDENGKEFYRHEGFFAEEEIMKLFETRNVKPLNN
ncbi:MAG TPA: thioredoxin family protein [Ignavibacteria bacterium]|nr:thioredoxin family protein [Ignavibacteria bacterium]